MRKGDLTRRRDEIIGLLVEQEEMSAAQLAARLGVSVQTIRKDLRDLDEVALVQRRNGVVRMRQQSENIAYAPRASVARLEKQRIAMAVRDLVADGARVALGTGTTVEACARMLAASRAGLTVMTNSLHAVLALQAAVGASVMLAGGRVRLRDLDVIGADSSAFFDGFLADVAVFSCGGLSPAGEVLDYNTDEVAARLAIQSCARRRVLVLDRAKLGRDLPCRRHMLWEYDVVVTGAELPEALRARCAEAGCEIVQVACGDAADGG